MPDIRVDDGQGNTHVFPDGSTPEMIAKAMGVKAPTSAPNAGLAPPSGSGINPGKDVQNPLERGATAFGSRMADIGSGISVHPPFEAWQHPETIPSATENMQALNPATPGVRARAGQDLPGAIGEGAANFAVNDLPLLVGARKPLAEGATSLGEGAARIGGKALDVAGRHPGAVGAAIGGTVGHPFMGAVVGRELLGGLRGRGAASAASPATTAPASEFSITPRPQSPLPGGLSGAPETMTNPGRVIAPPSAPVSAPGQFTSAPSGSIIERGGISGRAPTTGIGRVSPISKPSGTASMTATPEEEGLAKALGYKSAAQAEQSMGPTTWSKVAASPKADFGRQGSTSEQLADSKPSISESQRQVWNPKTQNYEDLYRQGSSSEQLAGSKPGMSKGRMAEQLRGESSPFGSRFKSTVEAPEEEDLSPWGGTFKKKEGR